MSDPQYLVRRGPIESVTLVETMVVMIDIVKATGTERKMMLGDAASRMRFG